MNLTARPAKSSRFVIWYGRPRTEEAEERDLLLGRLNLPDMSALHSVSDELLQSDLREETAFFLEYTGLGKLCVAIRHDPDARMNSHKDTADQSLATLELSVRASNCLKHAGIGTITDLVRWSPEQLLDLPNAGRKTIDEITNALLNRGILAPSPSEPFSTAPASSLDSTSEPPLNEFRLETLLSTAEAGLGEPLRSRLKLIGIRSLADIVQREASLVRTTADLQPAELEELANALRSRGLRWGMKLPEWQREHFSELADAFALELQEAIHVSSARIIDSEEPAIFEVANSLNDELESLFPKKTDQRNRTIVRAYLGLGGDVPVTLEETAQRFSLTRERVRQIAKPFERALDEVGKQLPWLEESLTILESLAPCTAQEAESALQARGIVRSALRLEGILRIAEGANIQHSFVIEGQRRLLLNQTMTDTVRKAISFAAKMVSHWGIANKDEVLAHLSCDASSRLAECIWAGLPGATWLDHEAKFFWMPTGRNAIANRLINILGVTPSLDLHDAYEGIFRDGRVNRDRVPSELFATLCRQYPWCMVAEGKIHATAELPHTDQPSHDDMIVSFLRETSGIGWRDDLWRRAQSVGIGKPSFDRLLSDSSVLVRHGEGLYGIIGTSNPSATNQLGIEIAEDPLEQNPIEARAETQGLGGSGLLSDCDPLSPLYPFRVLAIVTARGSSFKGMWSLAELTLSPSDRQALRLWGEEGNWDIRRDNRKDFTLDGLKMGGRHAISLTFLLFCSEVAREDAIEGEVWPAISSAMGDSLRKALFAQPSIPKAILRDATEEVCRNLRLRHVFGREGAQSWMRTVFLQFGFTHRGIKSLDRWLSAREHVPVAVEDLLDSTRGLQSHSFTEMWQTLLDLRWRSIDLLQANTKLHGNPWVLPAYLPELLKQAVTRRQRENDETDDDPDGSYRLLLNKTMDLSTEPSFVFHLNPNPPAWCDGERYTLEAGERRLPISRKDDYWQFDHAQTFVVPMENPCIEIDITQRRVSVMQQKLQLELTPAADFAFYDLKSGIEFGPAEQSSRGSKGIAVLCKSDIGIQPEPTEFIAVFGGHWKLILFRQGLPPDFTLVDNKQLRWDLNGFKTPVNEDSGSNIRVRIGSGWWGTQVQARVLCPAASDLRARNLVIAGQNVQLASVRSNEFVGMILLTPELEASKSAYVFCEKSGWINRISAAIEMAACAGAAMESEDGWVVLDGSADIELRLIRGRKLRVRPPLHEGVRKDIREWALLEGEHFIARPRQVSEELHGLEALGGSLSIAYGPYNNQERWYPLARSVTDTGCINGIVNNGSQGWTLSLSPNIGIGREHSVWAWMLGEDSPRRIDDTSWREVDGEINCFPSPGTILGFAFSYRGIRLGSRWIDGSWERICQWVHQTSNWRNSASWLRWWRAPVSHSELRDAIGKRVLQEPVSTIRGWLLDEPEDGSATQSEGQEEPWQTMVRSFLWGWQPSSVQSVEILGHFGLWTGYAESDMKSENYEVLLSTNPMLLAQVAINGAQVLYESAMKRELAALLRCLRNRILEPPIGGRWDEAYHEASLAASTDLNVDEQFLLKSVVGDARRYMRGELTDSRNLKLALGSLLLRQIVAARLLEDTAEEWTKA